MTISTGIRKAHRMGRHILSEDNGSGICAFGAVTDANHSSIDEYPKRVNAPCHAAYCYSFDKEQGKIHYIVDMLYPSDLDRCVKREWLSYVLLESPYSSMFAERGIDAGLKRGYYIYTPEVDGNILTGGSVAVRMLSEVPEIPKAFYTLSKSGMNKDIAFLVAHFVTINKDKKVDMLDSSEEGHVSVVPSWMAQEEVNNFMDCDFSGVGIYQDKRSYDNFNGMWGWSEYGETRHGNINKYFFDHWRKGIAELDLGIDTREAVFNHQWNRDKKKKGTCIEKHLALPILNNIAQQWLGE